MKDLSLNWNQLSGSIPPELGNLENLESLDLSQNQLTGRIPPELGDLSNLRVLTLYENHLTGNIPGALLNLTALEGLALWVNNLCVPDDYPDMGNPLHVFILIRDIGEWQNNQGAGICPSCYLPLLRK